MDGVFTATEGSAIAVVYATILSLFYRSIKLKDIPRIVAEAVLSLTDNRILIFLLMNVILLVVGTFMDATPAILIFTPIFLPICTSLGMNPIHFGIVICYNLAVGTITPPVGTILFTGCKVGGVTIESVMKHLLPYFAAIVIGLLLVTYIPVLSLAIPQLCGLI